MRPSGLVTANWGGMLWSDGVTVTCAPEIGMVPRPVVVTTVRTPVAVLSGYIGDIDGRSVAREILPLSYDENSIIYVDVTHKDGTDRCFYRTGALKLSRMDGITWSVDGDTVTVTASECVHAVEIESGLVAEDNYFTLLPGESRTVRLTQPEGEAVEYPITVDGYTHI